MKKFLNSRFGEAIILIASSIVSFILTLALYSIKLTDYLVNGYERGETTLWTCDQMFIGNYLINNFNLYFIAALLIGVLLMIISAVLALVKNKKALYYVSFAYNIALSLIILIINVASGILQGGAVLCAVLSAIVSAAALIFMIIRRNNQVAIEPSNEREISPKKAGIFKTGMLVCEIAAMVISFVLFVYPLYTFPSSEGFDYHCLIHALALSNGSCPIHVSICFILMFFACLASLFCFVSAISFFGKSNSLFAEKSQKYMYFTMFLSVLFFVMGYAVTFYMNLAIGGEYEGYNVTTSSYIPALCVMVTLVIHSVLQGRFTVATEIAETREIKTKKYKFEPLIYIIILTVITFASLALVLIDVKVSYAGYTAYEIKKTGFELITNYKDLDGELQTVSFAFVAILIVSSVFLVLSFVSYFTRSDNYYTITKSSAFTNFVFMLMVGLFGLYYQIAQKVNSEHIMGLLQQQEIPFLPTDYVEDVSSQSYIATIASFAVLLFMFFRKQFNLSAAPATAGEVAQASETAENPQPAATVAQEEAAPAVDKTLTNFDACPAFTELDGKINQFNAELENKRQNLFTNLTLPNLVRFVVDYARESRLHLSYSLEDIATFVAGLGASRLSILQGMSGTGKTSLPKIFTEAVMGNCEIVEVESSWRDKNELIGYYNEFSKCFTPKKFTQSLYKARLNSSVLTFIVLDEMNLSRIEYYFSDFLSLMENEEHKREIKLLNIKLFRRENGQAIPYLGLTDGHTIKIPTNVWFIGTANRDESTFEISDKVYDRAQTMNFNKRAPKVHSFSEPLPQRFASYDMLIKLFDEAKNEYVFEAEDNVIIQKVEKLLMPYNISFGNRILKQMEDFVKIYCTCFGDKSAVENDAVEKILLSKVVSKLENKIVENKEALATEFNKLGLSRCSAFIQKLNED